MITPHLTLKDIPAVVVNHTYKEIGLFPKDIVSGGTGIYYSADNIFSLADNKKNKEKMLSDTTSSLTLRSLAMSVKNPKSQLRSRGKAGLASGVVCWIWLLSQGTLSNHQTDGIRTLSQTMRRNSELRTHILRSSGCRFYKTNPLLSGFTKKRYLISSDSIMQGEVSEEDIENAC